VQAGTRNEVDQLAPANGAVMRSVGPDGEDRGKAVVELHVTSLSAFSSAMGASGLGGMKCA
jgi:hypothetical protein